MNFFPSKILLNKVKFMGKTLVVFILSLLLFFPTPALAFNLSGFLNDIQKVDFNKVVNDIQKGDLNQVSNELQKIDFNPVVNLIKNTVNPPASVDPSIAYNQELQSYISKLTVDFKGILESIQKLPTLPEKEGQESLATIDSQLQKLKEDSSNRAKQFDTWSNEQQKKYQELLNNINTMYQEQEVLKREVEAKKAELPMVERELGLEGSKYDEAYNKYEKLNREIQDNLAAARHVRRELDGLTFDPLGLKSSFNEEIRKYEGKNQELEPLRNDLKSRLDRISQLRNAVESKKAELRSKQSRIDTLEQNKTKLESNKQTIAEAAVLATRMSSFCNKAENDINLAKQNIGNVKEYADALSSFSDPDILGEIKDLATLVTNLSNKVSQGI
jgi:chromosome segregation ATPase